MASTAAAATSSSACVAHRSVPSGSARINTTLPVALLSHICTFLNFKELFCLYRSCHFYKILFPHLQLHQPIIFTTNPVRQKDRRPFVDIPETTTETIHEIVKKFHIRILDFDSTFESIDSELNPLQKQYVTSLKIQDHITPRNISSLLGFRNLKCLSIIFSIFSNFTDVFTLNDCDFPKLRFCTIYQFMVRIHHSSLTKLHIDSFSVIMRPSPEESLSESSSSGKDFALPALTSLQIEDYESQDEQSQRRWNNLFIGCSSIRELTIENLLHSYSPPLYNNPSLELLPALRALTLSSGAPPRFIQSHYESTQIEPPLKSWKPTFRDFQPLLTKLHHLTFQKLIFEEDSTKLSPLTSIVSIQLISCFIPENSTFLSTVFPTITSCRIALDDSDICPYSDPAETFNISQIPRDSFPSLGRLPSFSSTLTHLSIEKMFCTNEFFNSLNLSTPGLKHLAIPCAVKSSSVFISFTPPSPLRTLKITCNQTQDAIISVEGGAILKKKGKREDKILHLPKIIAITVERVFDMEVAIFPKRLE